MAWNGIDGTVGKIRQPCTEPLQKRQNRTRLADQKLRCILLDQTVECEEVPQKNRTGTLKEQIDLGLNSCQPLLFTQTQPFGLS